MAAAANVAPSGDNICKVCAAVRPSLWIQRGICFECDRGLRQQGQCPYGAGGSKQNSHCDPRLFCTHRVGAAGVTTTGGGGGGAGAGAGAGAGGGDSFTAAPDQAAAICGQCLLCDNVSCIECMLWRADGEETVRLVDQLEPHRIFLDWDRTLCSTKSGRSPLNGSHSLDPDLFTLMADHPGRVYVICGCACVDE